MGAIAKGLVLTSSTTQTLYTCPAGKSAVGTVSITNAATSGTTAVTPTLAYIYNGVTTTLARPSIVPGVCEEIAGIVLPAGAALTVTGIASSTVHVRLWGFEEVMAAVAKGTAVNSTNAMTIFTCPGGMATTCTASLYGSAAGTQTLAYVYGGQTTTLERLSLAVGARLERSGIVLPAGASLTVTSSAANSCYATVYGFEEPE